MRRSYFNAVASLTISIVVLFVNSTAPAYSVLSHEAIIDTAWDPAIKSLLLRRYPSASAAQLQEAHAYTYGGCIIQDMGYYPFGSRFFSDLTHYVRSGDFIMALLSESQNMYEYAFAVGALAHYAADNAGHPLAVNPSVPIIYPRLAEKYGKKVTFEKDPKAHVMVEFSFDVVQIAGAGYLPETYHNFIGFKVSKPLLERAFKRTYGLDLKDLFLSEDLAIGTYRRGASEVIPRMTQIAWKKKKTEIRRLNPTIGKREFIYRLSRANYEREWGKEYKKRRAYQPWSEPEVKMGLLARTLVFLVEILPKVGRLQTLSFKPPTPRTQKMFIDSFDVTVARYRKLLAEVQSGRLVLENQDFDTGLPTRAGEYELADKTYARLLDRLADNRFQNVTSELRNQILGFYGDLSSPTAPTREDEQWKRTLRELNDLKEVSIRAGRAEAAGLESRSQ